MSGKHLSAGLMLATVVAFGMPQAMAGGREDQSNLELQTGGFVFVSPKYEGSDEYEVFGFPIIAPSGSGIGEDGTVQFRGPDDLRFRLLNMNGFEAGPIAGYRFGRDEDDADRLEGLGDVDGGLVLGGYAAYRFGALKPFVTYNHAVTGDESGGLLRFGAEVNVPISSIVATKITGGATYADEDYMDAFFSVTPEQAAASAAGLSAYDAEGGIKDVFIGFSSDVPLWERWSLKVNGRYSHIVGEAADSPVVESESQYFAGLGLAYRFSLDR